MATRATLRARVRRELGDTGAVYIWSDDQVNDHLADAVRELSHDLPRDPVAVTLATVADQRTYAIGVDVADIVAVEYPIGTLLPEEGWPGVPVEATPDMADDGRANAWTGDVQAAAVRLRVAPPDSVSKLRVYYRPLLVAPGDDATAIAVEADEEMIVSLMACRTLWDLRLLEDAKRGNRTPGGNSFARRVEAALARRRRRVRPGSTAPAGLPVA